MSRLGFTISNWINRNDMIRVTEEMGYENDTFLSLMKSCGYTKKELVEKYKFKNSDFFYRFVWKNNLEKETLLSKLNQLCKDKKMIDFRERERDAHGNYLFFRTGWDNSPVGSMRGVVDFLLETKARGIIWDRLNKSIYK